jgi:hypothetical protein
MKGFKIYGANLPSVTIPNRGHRRGLERTLRNSRDAMPMANSSIRRVGKRLRVLAMIDITNIVWSLGLSSGYKIAAALPSPGSKHAHCVR